MMMLLNYAIKLMIGTHTHTHLHSIQTVMIEQKPSCCELVSLFIADRKITLCSDLDFCKNDSFPEKIFFWPKILATGTGSYGLDELKDELNANKIRP